MKTTLIFITIMAASINALGFTGVIKSSDPKEPQVIVIKEDPNNTDRITYRFCLNERMEECVSLGNPDGLSKELLSTASGEQSELKEFMTYFQPVASIATLVAAGYITVKTAGATWIFLAASGSYMLVDLIYADENSPRLISELALALNPNSSGLFLLEEGISIVDFSNELEDKLKDIEDESSDEKQSTTPRLIMVR